ncbi:MAG: HAD family hydrolase [Alphaproteobacteria bacterium]
MSETSASRTGAVIIDVDGVLLSFSNRRFYARMVLEVARSLRHLSPNRKNIMESIRTFKKSGAAGLFVYLNNMSRDTGRFEKICRNISGNMNYDNIMPDPQLKKYLESLSHYKNIIIRTDGISDIAGKAFHRLMGGDYHGKDIIISDIRDNGFRTKTDRESWNLFAEKYNVDLSKSILIDDSKSNIATAEEMGKKGYHVCRARPLHSILGNILCSAVWEHQDRKREEHEKKKKAFREMRKQIKKNRHQR